MNKGVNLKKWFYFFVSIHVFFWTLLPSLIRYNLPMDAIEGGIWGKQLALGYDKNPWMNAWLTELAIKLGGQSGWMTYLFSQLTVAICFWALWKLARKIISPVHALIAVFLLELISVFNIDAIDFNDNVLELGLWSLMILYFYSAVKEQKIRDWVFVGIFTGLAIMTKYYVAVLLLPMFLFLLMGRENRQSFCKPGLYIAAIVCLIISLPHFIWLFSHDFITIKYAFMRVANGTFWFSRFSLAGYFLFSVVAACVLPLLVFGTLYLGRAKGSVVSATHHVSTYQWRFLLLMGFGPLVVTLLCSLVGGAYLHVGWNSPLFLLYGIILMAWLQPVITRSRFYRFVIILFSLLALGLFAYTFSLVKHGNKSSANYPGKVIATKLTNDWYSRYHTKLQYIVGTRFAAGSVALYSKDRPSVYVDADKQISFWINEKKLKQDGALFVWNQYKGEYKKGMFKRFDLKDVHTEKFYWMRNKKISPVVLQVGFLPPNK